MKSVKFLSIAALLMIFISCSKDDDNDDVNNDDLSISLGITGYKAAFYQSGYTDKRSVEPICCRGYRPFHFLQSAYKQGRVDQRTPAGCK